MAYQQQAPYQQQQAYPQQGGQYPSYPPAQGYGQNQAGAYPQQQHQQQHQQQPGSYMSPPPHSPHPPPTGGAPVSTADRGSFPGGTYSIDHRDTNAVLGVDLAQGAAIRSKPGAMIHMAATVQLTGKFKFSLRKALTGGELNESTYVGPGRVALGPTMFGDIVSLHVDGTTKWKIGRDAFLACTQDVRRETKAQGFAKALFSGEDLFIYHVTGNGLMWLTSFGAVDRLELRPGEQHIVDNGHLVAWNCDYTIEKAGGGAFTSLKTGEGLVCRFTGPGSIYIQTRNLDEFQQWVQSVTVSNAN